MRKRYTSAFKAKIVQEAIKEEKTLAQIASDKGIPPNQITHLSLSEQAALLTLRRSNLYSTPRPPSAREVAIKHRLDALYTETPFYGARRLSRLLRAEGREVSRKTVRAYRQQMGLEAIYPKPNLSAPHLENRIYPYLLRGIRSAYPNPIWGIDITYLRRQQGWMYLAAVLDWYSRWSGPG